ncbi:cyclic AMP-responsive element-binding protein 1 isoform X11 [Aethina tumida]|uniref:cyclic AMP-responsive element-binding protein 1 isoform X11 n=1 Tax=Aethina tumida TaxID=116153 RepID=UPI00096AE1FF|nr:cyclic AMP-responsive element-binding protein 1 isoform X11 [Aethina tumida]
MDGMVEENGAVDPLSTSPDPQGGPIVSSVQSVIQPNTQSVIQTATNLQPMLGKGNVILVSKPNSVIQTTQGNLQTLRVVETASDDSFSEDESSPKKRRDLLTRRPSYRKILNDLGGGEIAETKVEQTSSEGDSELSSHSIPYHTVLPATAIQISSGEGGQSIHTLTMTNATAGGAIVQYAQGQEFFVPGQFYSPVVAQSGSLGSSATEDQARKKEMRLLKNREAARECRRKKKEYIKCLENRVAVLENQNKTLIDELKTLKELYCQQKVE